MSYTDEGIDGRAEVLYGAPADSLTYFAKSNGALIAMDVGSAYVTVLDPGGSQVVARTQTGVVATPATGAITLTQAFPIGTYQLWEDYCVLVEWSVLGVAFSDRFYFDVVRNKLPCLIDDNDLQEVYPDLAQHLASVGLTDARRFIKRAWSMMLDRMRSGKNRPSLILDRARLVNPAIHLALSFACGALARSADDIWHLRQVEHHKLYAELFAGLGELKYDRDEDARAGDGETKRLNRRTFTV